MFLCNTTFVLFSFINFRVQYSFWGWMSVLGRFMSSFVYMGTSKALGVLIPTLVIQLESSEGAIGLCTSLFAGLPHIAGMLVPTKQDSLNSKLVHF